MAHPHPMVRWWLFFVLAPLLAGMFWLGERRVAIETDITSSIPGRDPVLADARFILQHHPALDRIAIDISLAGDGEPDPERLVDAAEQCAARLRASGLFDEVGTGRAGNALAGLLDTVTGQLPVLFTAEELAAQVQPLLEPAVLRGALEQRRAELLQLDGVGQAEAMARDPLGLRLLVLGRLQHLLAGGGSAARIYRNHLLSPDGRHLLLLANPKGSGSDTAFARELADLFENIARELAAPPAAGGRGAAAAGPQIELAVAGGFRAALDNEQIIRHDTEWLLLLATIGIALLFLACFPRPLLGLLAMLPALAGVAAGLLVYSLLFDRISALALGFGGALVSITVDQGAAYLLFLDRTRATTGREAAREIRWPGLFSTLTNASAFLALHFSGYPLLEQLGVFAALALVFSFAFVHLVFPLIFPRLPPARRTARLPLERLLSRVAVGRGWTGPVAVGGLGLLLLGWAIHPRFSADLNAMNTVRPATLAAEEQVKRIWGDVLGRVYLLQHAATLPELLRGNDGLARFLDGQRRAGNLATAFTPSMLLPGSARAEENQAAWRSFWTPVRSQALAAALAREGAALGFADDAFSPFLAATAGTDEAPLQLAALPTELHGMLGIARARTGTGWVWLGPVVPGPGYRAADFAAQAEAQGYRVFDPRLFAERLAGHLSSAFLRMLLIIGAAVVVLLALLFFDLRLVLLALAPLVFALVATLGTLALLGHPIDIPGLMLAIIVLGLGIDASLFFLRSYQTLQGESHESHGPMRLAIFLTAASMLVGMATLALADHAVLRSCGITGTVATLYLILGAFALLPPFLRRIYPPAGEGRPWESLPVADARAAAVRRYRFLDPYVRFFAWFKLRLDPMFQPRPAPRLAELVGPARTLLDVGCGWGVPGTWLLARLPGAKLVACEPDEERARVARRVFGERGSVTQAGAPALPELDRPVDAALLLDVVHHLPDEALAATLAGLHRRLAPGGRLVLRATVPSAKRLPWERWLEKLRSRLRPGRPGELHFRPVPALAGMLAAAGFAVERIEPTAPGREETWFVGKPCGVQQR